VITVGQLLEWSAKNYPNKLGLSYLEKNQAWTFKEFDEKANQLAHALVKLGIKKGDVVSTFLYNTSEFALAQFATAKIGAIFNPINYRLTASELQFIVQDARSKVLLFEQAVENIVLKAVERGIQLDHYIYVDSDVPDYAVSFYELLASADKTKPEVEVTEDDLYIMMYTSGTTGKPKGVLHRHRSMVHHNFLMMQCMGLTKNDIGLSVAPLNHTAELHTSFLPRVQVGATNIIMHHFDVEKVLETIEREKVTHLFLAPTMVNMLLNHPRFDEFDLSSLRLLGYGGASMAPVLIKRFLSRTKAELVQMYGTTEMGPVMSVLYSDEQLSKAGAAGKAILTHELKIVRVKEDGTPTHPDDECEVNEVGEIIVRGPSMMMEYYNRKDATEEALAHGWYHTGDMGFVDRDGYIWISDRMDYMINSGAENVYPREVEDSILEHPDVEEVAVIGKPDSKWGQIVTAFIVRKPGTKLTIEEMKEFLIKGEKLARYKHPREYYFVAELPKTASGKIQKFILEKQVKETEKDSSL